VSGGPIDIRNASDDAARLGDVLRLYRAHSQTLGFMPKGGFLQRAKNRTLLVAVDPQGNTAGYILYDLPNRQITIRHLCIDSDHRGLGIARLFVDYLKAQHPERLGIKAECRNDYDAHGMWPELDFEALSEAPGRSKQGLPLTTWWLDFDHPTLFSARNQDRHRIRIAMDTDVFIDLFEERPNSAESRGLMSDWVTQVSELVITKAVLEEVSNHDDPLVRSRRRSDAIQFTRADSPRAQWKATESRLLASLGGVNLSPHDRRDVRHVARAAAAGVGYFTSRDDRLIRRLREPAWDHFQLRIQAPGDLVTHLWAQIGQAYAPVMLENTRFTLEPAMPAHDQELFRAFLNTGKGERKGDFTRRLRAARADPTKWELRLIRCDDSTPAGLFVRSVGDGPIHVPLLRVAGRTSGTLSRHIAHLLRQSAIDTGKSTIIVDDVMMSMQVPEGLGAEGFVQSDTTWWSAVVDCHATSDVLAENLAQLEGLPQELERDIAIAGLRGGQLDPQAVAELEARFSPMKVAGAEIATFVISIKPVWAEQLFDTDLSRQTLFGRPNSLGISREHVYYSGAAKGSLTPPARIVWYVSSDDRRPGTGAVRACSRLEEVEVGRPLDLYRRFSHLGVYRRDQVLAMGAKSGSLMALRFSETEIFENPIPFADLTRLANEHGRSLVLQSPQRLPDEIFDILYKRGRNAPTG
jgi:Acetyltransferase (GNAT) domain